MGPPQSKPQQNPKQPSLIRSPMPPPDQEDLYILEDLNKITLGSKKKQHYLWVDAKMMNSENQKYQNILKKSIDVKGFITVEALEGEMDYLGVNTTVKVICAASLKDDDYHRLSYNPRITDIYLFCQNEERAKLLMTNFPKIKEARFEISQLKECLLEEEENDGDLGPKTNFLIITEEDTNLINKYRINFHTIASGIVKNKAKADFIQFAEKFYPNSKAEIAEFKAKYQLNLPEIEAAKQTMQWVMKPGFFWESIQTLPKMTTNPKKLAYLRFPFKETYKAIQQLYRSETVRKQEAYMVLTPTSKELKKLKDAREVEDNNASKYLIFTTFSKAFTSEKKALELVSKNPKSIFVRVMMKLHPIVAEDLDFGYWVENDLQEGPNVIFNIYNVFEISEIEEKSMTILYGSLAHVVCKREKERNSRLNPHQLNLLRNYDYLEDIISRINSQATILQMSGYFQDSLEVYNQKLSVIRKSQASQELLDEHTIQLGDAYRINEDFDKAEKELLSIKEGKGKLRANVHLAELYFKSKDKDKLEKIIKEIQSNINKYKEIGKPDSFKAQNYIGMEMINRGLYKQASRLYRSLIQDINQSYDFKFEGIPLVHEIYRNLAACETKLKNFTEALSLLGSAKDWQKGCEGNKSPTLIITENLIKSAYESRGEKENAMECEGEVNRLKKATSMEENLYLSRSAVFTNLVESAINVSQEIAKEQKESKQQKNLSKSGSGKSPQRGNQAPSQNLSFMNLNESTINIQTSNEGGKE